MVPFAEGENQGGRASFRREKTEFTLFIYWSCLMACAEKAMATHSSTLAWKIPWTEGPGGLQSMGSLGVGHD